jgi:DNA-directed RNA polymerase subunit RPC12/RpoP
MVNWTTQQLDQIQQFSGKKYETVLNEISDDKRRWKCFTCKTIFDNSDLVNNTCPVCGEHHIVQMCPMDTINGCEHSVADGIADCPVCHQPVCPVCGGNHSVITISRVTGYLSSVDGWNNAKKAELKDRMRYNPLSLQQIT